MLFNRKNTKHMKYLRLLLILFGSFTLQAQNPPLPADAWTTEADALLTRYVRDGEVDYRGLQNQLPALKRLVQQHPVNALPTGSGARQAAYINLYNLAVLQQVLSQYPVEGPQQLPGFFSVAFIPWQSGRISLDELEKGQLLKDYPDARLHLILVCAARSCPPLYSGAYRAEQLEQQLARQTRAALDDPRFIRVPGEGSEVALSQIFKWYRTDFEREAGSVRAWINRYRSEPLPADAALTYYDYDWSLNEAAAVVPVEKPRSIIQEFTPSRLLPKGSWEAKVFNNLYTQTREADAEGNTFNVPRATFLTNIIEGFAGVSPNARVNVGLILTLRSSLISGSDTEQPALDALRYGNDELFARSGLAYIAPSVRITPFRSLPRLSFQSSFQLPAFDEESINGVFFAERSYIFANKVYYDHSFGNGDWQLFTEVAFDFLFGDAVESYANNSGFLPISAFLSYFPSSRLTFYANTQHARRIDLGNNFSQDFTLVGLGAKYQLTDALNVEVSHARFIAGHSSGLGATYNLGFRYVNL